MNCRAVHLVLEGVNKFGSSSLNATDRPDGLPSRIYSIILNVTPVNSPTVIPKRYPPFSLSFTAPCNLTSKVCFGVWGGDHSLMTFNMIQKHHISKAQSHLCLLKESSVLKSGSLYCGLNIKCQTILWNKGTVVILLSSSISFWPVVSSLLSLHDEIVVTIRMLFCPRTQSQRLVILCKRGRGHLTRQANAGSEEYQCLCLPWTNHKTCAFCYFFLFDFFPSCKSQ